ncbi:MAG: hypothetical protein AAFX50_22630, partial [Acidobacteriota bacterium]
MPRPDPSQSAAPVYAQPIVRRAASAAVLVTLLAAGCGTPTAERSAAEKAAADAGGGPAAEGSDGPTFTPEQLRDDLSSLYSQLRSAHFDLYAHTAKADYDARFEDLRTRLDRPLDAFDAAATFQRFMAVGRIGHARIDFPADAYAAYRAAGGTSPPFYFRVIDGRVLVTESYAPELGVG